MRSLKVRNLSVIPFIGLLIVVISANLNWNHKYWQGILESDARGYYAYLPAVFIYHDLSFAFYEPIERDKYNNTHFLFEYRQHIQGKRINKYYVGTAIACSPFFFVAHLISYFSGKDMDGYSFFYPVFISIAAIFYLLAGLFFLEKSLRSFKLKHKHVSLVLLAGVFGTNLFYYTVVEPGMSHVYSFAFVSAWIYFAISFFNHRNWKHVFIFAFISAMIFLIRPVNSIVFLSLPFLSGSINNLKESFNWLFHKPFYLIGAFSLFLLIIFIQFYIYKISVGDFFVYSYKDEHFYFQNPQIINFLFSYKKGLFLYTPFYFISLLGLVHFWKQSKFQWATVSLFLILVVYTLSSWWNWYYGGSFSSRVMVDFLPFFILLAGLAYSFFTKPILRRIYTSLLFIIVIFCQIQTYQYRYNQIHWEEMDKEKYWDVFLRIDRLL